MLIQLVISNKSVLKLIVLDWNTWNYKIVLIIYMKNN